MFLSNLVCLSALSFRGHHLSSSVFSSILPGGLQDVVSLPSRSRVQVGLHIDKCTINQRCYELKMGLVT